MARLYAMRRRFRIDRPANPHPVWWNGRQPDPAPELRFSHDELVEVTARELRDDKAQYGPRLCSLKLVDYRRAHQWVRDGGHHSTPLYTDCDGRIRYATGGEC